MEDDEAMVAGPVTNAEGDEQAGRDLPDLRLWPEFGIPAPRAEQAPGQSQSEASVPGVNPPAADPADPMSAAAPTSPSATPVIPAQPASSASPALPQGPMTSPFAPQGPHRVLNQTQIPGQAWPQGPVPGRTLPYPPRALSAARPVPELAGPSSGGSIPTQPSDPFRGGAAVPQQPAAAPIEAGGVGFTDAAATVPDASAAVPGVGAGVGPGSGPVPGPVCVPAEFGSIAVPTVEPFPAPEGEQAGDGPGTDEPAPDTGTQPTTKAARRSHRASSMRRQTSSAIAVLGWLAVSFLVLHRYLPDVGGVGSLLETWLPWIAVPVVALLVAAGIVHTRRALIATLAAALVWTALYGPQLLPRGSDAPAQLHIFSEDVNGVTSEVTTSGTMALAQHADIVALEDVYSNVSQSSSVNALNNAYKYHVTEYEFGLWSRYPISAEKPITLGTTQDGAVSLDTQSAGMAAATAGTPVIGALEATISMPDGKPLTVYLLHLPQPVLGNQGFAKARDAALTQLVAVLKADTSPRLAVIGDVNVAATDRQFSQLTQGVGLQSAQQAAGSGFGFTWPAEFPIVRLDDVLTRGLQPLRSSVLPAIAGGQSHLPIEVDLDY
ncbi:hypothetical protein KDL01_02685 [Actinospica durhamensis]|uniref:Endonuclease/exonuclease/phosphatase domain-containing protein n=1 Tax=Actinospica durhamensis TaxID=1508375 RepID=A0A941EKE7_9ACTN|nr:endonuclease/exonuclease/phosphatase family protein [Actinospica durhamensis]MBR7832147.1 hypothetical protein [Actinospica durhamensis]